MSGVNYLLIAVITALLFGVLKGYRRGFLRLAVSLASLIFVILIVTKISPFVSDFLINNSGLYENTRQRIITIYAEQNSVLDNTVSENQNITIESYNLPEIITGTLRSNNTKDMYGKLAAALFEEYIAGYLAKIVIKAGSFCGLFVILGIAMMCILAAIKILEKIPVLRTFNRLLGMFAGFGISLIFVWIFFLAIMIFFGNSLGNWMFMQIKSSRILSFVFNNNLLFQFLLN